MINGAPTPTPSPRAILPVEVREEEVSVVAGFGAEDAVLEELDDEDDGEVVILKSLDVDVASPSMER